MGERIIIGNKKLMINIMPVKSGKQVIGLIGLILFRNLNAIKKALFAFDDSSVSKENDIFDIFVRRQNFSTFSDYIGQSKQVQNMIEQCRKMSKSHYTVLLIGETGTGKEVLANAIYNKYRGNSNIPFIKINCSAIPYDLLESELFGHEKGSFTGANTTKIGKFELAAGGIILLDEIGEMDMRLQSKLLRVLEEKEFERIGGNKLFPVKARIIATTNKDLFHQTMRGEFRQDLYYRLNTFEIRIPPLRSRKDDLPLLIQHFISKEFLSYSLSDEAVNYLVRYDWPGNVRELRNLLLKIQFIYPNSLVGIDEVKQIFEDLFSRSLNTDPAVMFASVQNGKNITEPRPSPFSLQEQEKTLIIDALTTSNFNISRTAKMLNISRSALYQKIKRNSISIVRQMKNDNDGKNSLKR